MWQVTYPPNHVTSREIVETYEGLVGYYTGAYVPHKNYVRTGVDYDNSWIIPNDLTQPICEGCGCNLIGKQRVDRNVLSYNTLAIPQRWQLCDECLIWDITDQNDRLVFAEGCLAEYWKPGKQSEPWIHQTKPGFKFFVAFGTTVGQFLYMTSTRIEPVK